MRVPLPMHSVPWRLLPMARDVDDPAFTSLLLVGDGGMLFCNIFPPCMTTD